jgi:hypothetical protein
LTLPPGRTWRSVSANVFSVVNGKRILFEDDDSLFHQLRNGSSSVQLIREQIAVQYDRWRNSRRCASLHGQAGLADRNSRRKAGVRRWNFGLPTPSDFLVDLRN